MSEAPVGWEFAALAPLLIAGLGACGLLLLEVILSARWGGERQLVSNARIGILVATFASVLLGLAGWKAGSAFSLGGVAVFNPARPMLLLDPFASLTIVILSLAGLLAVWLSIAYLQALHINHGEYHALVLLSITGMFAVVSSVDLIALFVGLELMALPLYVLSGFDRNHIRSNEAALKHFLSGALATGFTLYGVALLYGAAGSTQLAAVRGACEEGSGLAQAGLALLLSGLAVRLALPPFHQWLPDVYEGAPASVSGLLSVTAKLAVFAALLRLWVAAFAGEHESIVPVLRGVAIAAMVLGSAMAVIQSSFKRLLAYATLAQLGIVVTALVIAAPDAYAAALLYLFVLVFMNLGAFGVVVTLAQGGRETEGIREYAGLARSRPGLAAVTLLFLLSLAGLPGTAGFTARFGLLASAVRGGEMVLVLVALATSLVLFFAYLRVPAIMYMHAARDERTGEMGTNEFLVLLACAVVVVYYGVFFDLAPFEAAVSGLAQAAAAGARP